MHVDIENCNVAEFSIACKNIAKQPNTYVNQQYLSF